MGAVSNFQVKNKNLSFFLRNFTHFGRLIKESKGQSQKMRCIAVIRVSSLQLWNLISKDCPCVDLVKQLLESRIYYQPPFWESSCFSHLSWYSKEVTYNILSCLQLWFLSFVAYDWSVKLFLKEGFLRLIIKFVVFQILNPN